MLHVSWVLYHVPCTYVYMSLYTMIYHDITCYIMHIITLMHDGVP